MFSSSYSQMSEWDLAVLTENKISRRAQQADKNLRQLILLCNTLDEYRTKQFVAYHTAPLDDKPLVMMEEEVEESDSDDDDEEDSEDDFVDEVELGRVDTDEPPPYMLYTSPNVVVTEEECSSSDEDSDSDSDSETVSGFDSTSTNDGEDLYTDVWSDNADDCISSHGQGSHDVWSHDEIYSETVHQQIQNVSFSTLKRAKEIVTEMKKAQRVVEDRRLQRELREKVEVVRKVQKAEMGEKRSKLLRRWMMR